MAEHGAMELGAATGTDYAEHKRTYDGFLRLLKWCMGAIALVLILMAFFLT